MSDQEENSAPSLPRRENAIQELDQEASSNDKDANALDSWTYSQIEPPLIKMVEGKENYTLKHILFPISLWRKLISKNPKLTTILGMKSQMTSKVINATTLATTTLNVPR